MQMEIRQAGERGIANHGWLKSAHTFSFGDYHDPKHMGFHALRVINEDRVAAGGGFPTHGHRDMEILSYVLEGQLGHKDSMGTGSVIRPGDIQRMSAGTGVQHSEMNASKTEGVHFLQIWIIPDRAGHAPGYEQLAIPEAERRGQWRVIAAGKPTAGAVTVHQDVTLSTTIVDKGETRSYQLPNGRNAWVHVARGAAEVAGVALTAGGAVGITDGGTITVTGSGDGDTEVLLFDLA